MYTVYMHIYMYMYTFIVIQVPYTVYVLYIYTTYTHTHTHAHTCTHSHKCISTYICVYLFICRLIGKYHPKNVTVQKEAQRASLQSRIKAYLYLQESGRLDVVPLWADCMDDIINTMDAGEYLYDCTCISMYRCSVYMLT